MTKHRLFSLAALWIVTLAPLAARGQEMLVFEAALDPLIDLPSAWSIDPDDFESRFRIFGKEIGDRLGVRPRERKASATQGLQSEGWTWRSAAGIAVLERNPGAPEKAEFLRMRIARPDAKGVYAAAMEVRNNVSVRDADLLRNVKKDENGNVYVDGVPMVDQGQKGYCVVAAVQRLFEYYGIPLLWSLTLGIFPEEPPISLQESGGHMRMIVGYNDKENRIVFSDSWGAGHEFKTMDANDAYRATEGLYVLKPTVH